MNDPLETVSPTSPPRPPSPESMAPEPRQRRQRWAAFEDEIARTIILPKLQGIWATHSPDTVEGFFGLYRDQYEPDCTLSSFTEYLRILNIRTRRITVFEGFEVPQPKAPAPAPAGPREPLVRSIRLNPTPAPAPEPFDGFDNEEGELDPDMGQESPLLEGEQARAILAALNLSPD